MPTATTIAMQTARAQRRVAGGFSTRFATRFWRDLETFVRNKLRRELHPFSRMQISGAGSLPFTVQCTQPGESVPDGADYYVVTGFSVVTHNATGGPNDGQDVWAFKPDPDGPGYIFAIVTHQ